MRQALMWVTVALCCVAGAAAGSERQDERLTEATAALEEAERLAEAHRFPEAVTLAERALALREEVLGGTALRVVEVLDALGRFHAIQGEYALAEPCFTRALSIVEEKRGKGHPLVVVELNRLATLYSDQGAYARAAPMYERLLAIDEGRFGPKDPRLIRTLTLVGRMYRLQDLYAKAQPFYERALAIGEAAMGKDDPNIAGLLSNLARIYQDQEQYARAEPLYLRSVAVVEADRGSEHPELSGLINNLGNLYSAQGQYARAEPLYQRALTVGEETLGKDHPDVLQAVDNLANIYKAQGKYAQAEVLYLRALAVREAAQDTSPLLVVDSLEKLATLYSDQGLYARAEPFLQRALAIKERVLGGEHPGVASSVQLLATLYTQQGLHARAEPLYERALSILEAALGKSHPELMAPLNGLATAYQEQGMISQAEPLYARALAIGEAAFGKSDARIVIPLTNLAGLYRARADFGGSLSLYERALAISEATYGKTHSSLVALLVNFATLELQMQEPARAEPLYQRAIAVGEATLGKNHPDVAQALLGLAALYQDQRLYTRAEPLYERARAITEATLGESHPAFAVLLLRLAGLRVAQNRLDDALPLLSRALDLAEQHLRQESLGLTETRRDRFLATLPAGKGLLYTLLEARPDDARVRRLVLSAALLLKGRSVGELAETSRTLYRSLGAKDREAFERLRGLRSQIAALALQRPSALPPENASQRLKSLEKQANALEAELAQRSAPLRALTTRPGPDEIVDRVAQGLPSDGALVEFISDEDWLLEGKPGTHEPEVWVKSRYVALVLFPGGSIRAVDLGDAVPIDKAAVRLRDALAGRDADFQAPAQALYELAFRPLLPLLGKAHRLFISPDGQLNLVPFAALHDGRQFLVDSFDFTYLTSGRELLPRPQGVAPSSSVVVMADPDFRASLQTPAAPANAGDLSERSSLLERFFLAHRADLSEQSWTPLPGTRQEAQAIQRLIPQARLFLGAEATKDRLFHLPTPGVLHLATHGFFLADASGQEASRAVGHFGALGDGGPTRLPADSLLRSGLVLAGARAPAFGSEGGTEPRLDSALVTASEMAGLDLWGTQLVVLSACDTGRGEIRSGQGVYGLRRALVAAGAETVAMSLWKVDDVTTSHLMEAYYRNLLAGQGRAAALREAMLALRGSHPHPHYWAPFIVLGRDTPLSGLGPASRPSRRK